MMRPDNSGAVAYFVMGAACYLYGEYNYYHEKLKFKDSLNYMVKLTSPLINSSNNGKLLYLTGKLFGSKPLQDERSTFKFSLPDDSVALIRTVEIYQKKWIGSGLWQYVLSTSNWYDKVIEDSVIRQPFQQQGLRSLWFVSPTRVGPFGISKNLVQQVDLKLPIPGGLPAQIGLQINPKRTDPKETVWFKKQADGWYYQIDNKGTPGSPERGDIRMKYRYVPGNTEVSILAKQDGRKISAFTSPVGTQIEQLHSGALTLDDFIEKSIDPNGTWNRAKLEGMAVASVGIILANSNKYAAKGLTGTLFGAWLVPRVWHLVRFGMILLPPIIAGSEVVYQVTTEKPPSDGIPSQKVQ